MKSIIFVFAALMPFSVFAGGDSGGMSGIDIKALEKEFAQVLAKGDSHGGSGVRVIVKGGNEGITCGPIPGGNEGVETFDGGVETKGVFWDSGTDTIYVCK